MFWEGGKASGLRRRCLRLARERRSSRGFKQQAFAGTTGMGAEGGTHSCRPGCTFGPPLCCGLRTGWCTPLPHLPFPPWAAHSNGRRGRKNLAPSEYLLLLWRDWQGGHCWARDPGQLSGPPATLAALNFWAVLGSVGPPGPGRGNMYFLVPRGAAGDLVKRTSTAASHRPWYLAVPC